MGDFGLSAEDAVGRSEPARLGVAFRGVHLRRRWNIVDPLTAMVGHKVVLVKDPCTDNLKNISRVQTSLKTIYISNESCEQELSFEHTLVCSYEDGVEKCRGEYSLKMR